MPERETSIVVAAYQDGLALAREGEYFDAHEAFETAWRACAVEERDFFQGLVHVVVSAYQRGAASRSRPSVSASRRCGGSRRSRPRIAASTSLRCSPG